MDPNNRLKRLEKALKVLPYNNHLGYTPEQECIQQIIARLSAPQEPIASTSKAAKERIEPIIPVCDIIQKFRPDLFKEKSKVNKFPEEAVKQIGNADNEFKSADTMTSIFIGTASITDEIKKRPRADGEEEVHPDVLLDAVDLKEMYLNHMDLLIKRRIAVIERWEKDRSKVLQFLLIEVSKLKDLETKVNEKMGELNLSDVKKFKSPDVEDKLLTEATEGSCSHSEDQGKDNKNIGLHQTVEKESFINEGFDFGLNGDSEMVLLGPNGTEVHRRALKKINWNLSGPAITRKLLCEVFDRSILAFASLTGKPSPAFIGCPKEPKIQLDPFKVADITFFLTSKLDITAREIRNAITTKCADENKMQRNKLKKLNSTGGNK